MSENVIIAIIGAVGTLTGAIIGTIGAVLIAKMNRPPQEQKMPLPPSSGFSKIKVALITAVVGLVAGLLISFWGFSGKSPDSQENGAVTSMTNVSEPIPAQKKVASATPIPKAASDSIQTQASAPTQEAVPTEEPTQEAVPTEEPAPTEEAAPKETPGKSKPAPKEKTEKSKPAPKEGAGKKKK